MKLILNDLNIFCFVVKNGSLTKAASQLDMPLATLSRRLMDLEKNINCKLFFRGGNKITPTPIGEEVYKKCCEIIFNLNDEIDNIRESYFNMSGVISISSPRAIYYHTLNDKILKFQKKYPDIRLDIDLHLTRHESTNTKDIIVCSDTSHYPSYTQKKISVVEFILCASPDYLNTAGIINNFNEIKDHIIIKVSPYNDWTFTCTDAQHKIQKITIAPVAKFYINEFELAKELVLQNHGIALLPYPLIANDLVNGRLTHLLPNWKSVPVTHFILYAHHKNIPQRVLKLIQFITE